MITSGQAAGKIGDDQSKKPDSDTQLGGQEQSQSFCAPSCGHGLSTSTQASQPGGTGMIELRGLSPLQQELAERMWNMESMEDIVAWVQTMPRSVALQAYIVMQMIIAAEIDRQAEDDVSAAQAIIERIRSC
jgi:hypothetical protein